LRVRREWRGLHNEQLNDLCCSPYIVRVIKSRRMRLVGHVARRGGDKVLTRLCWGNLTENDNWKDPGVDEKIILKRVFKNWDGSMDWINLALNRDKWPDLVNAVKKHRVIY
jgi:hypothetical protein